MPERKGTILYVGGFELPDKNAAAHRVLNNGKIFRELGYKVVFLGISHEATQLTAGLVQGFDMWSIPYPKTRKEWNTYLTSIDVVKEVAGSLPDLKFMVFYNYQSVCLWKAMKYCKKRKIKTIVDVTEWYMAPKSNPIFYAIKQSDTSVRMRYLNKKADGIIAISSYLKEYYEKSGCRNVIQLPPLVDIKEPKWHQSTKKKDDNKIHIVYAGSTNKDKDKLNVVIHSLADAEVNVEFSIVGISSEDYLSNYLEDKELIDLLVKKCVVRFLGRLPHVESLRLLQEADYSVFYREATLLNMAGFPTKFVESITCGTPVITTNTSDLSIYIKNGELGGYLLSNNNFIEELRDALHNNTMIYVDCSIFDYKKYIDEIADLINKSSYNKV